MVQSAVMRIVFFKSLLFDRNLREVGKRGEADDFCASRCRKSVFALVAVLAQVAALPLAAMAAGAQQVDVPIYLNANDLTHATGRPSFTVWKHGAAAVPVWSMSGEQAGQSFSGVTPPLPLNCAAVRVEILTMNESAATNAQTAVYRVHLASLVSGMPSSAHSTDGKPVLTAIPSMARTLHTTVLDGCRIVQPGAPLALRIQREPDDAGDTYTSPEGLVQVKVTPLSAPPSAVAVESSPGYNSWPMIQAIGSKLVCAYSRGSGHDIGEGRRDAYARTSTDGGRTWAAEVVLSSDPLVGEVMIGKGLDNNGAALFWVRCIGRPKSRHELYRTTDGVTFTKIAVPQLDPFPMQITDVFHTPSGLMSLWFATDYKEDGKHSWGTLVSADNGATWVQRTVESVAKKGELPTEPSAVHLGNGRILAVARTETGGGSMASQFQLTSTDGGVTWTRRRTNIRDVMSSTPSLIYDSKTGMVSNYYYERGRGVVKRRVAKADAVFDNPMAWPDPVGVAFGCEERPWDAGNVNATVIGDAHCLTYYAGTKTDTSVYAIMVK